MTIASRISVADGRPTGNADMAMGEDWTDARDPVDTELRAKREQRNFISLNRSPLARKIVTFNLLALVILVAGVLFLNPFRDSLVAQREAALVSEAQLIADVFEAQLPDDVAVDLAAGEGVDAKGTLSGLDLDPGINVYVFSPAKAVIARSDGEGRAPLDGTEGLHSDDRSTVITNFLNTVWEGLSGLLGPNDAPVASITGEDEARKLLPEALSGATRVRNGRDGAGGSIFSVATPIELNGEAVGVIALTTVAGQIDQLVRSEREQVLQMFVIAILVSIGLSLVLASTIANPLSDLAAAAELGREKNARKMSPSRGTYSGSDRAPG